jgi:hypothetical protein
MPGRLPQKGILVVIFLEGETLIWASSEGIF